MRRALPALFLLAAAAYVVTTTWWWAFAGSHPLPYWDAWEFVVDLRKLAAGTYGLGDLLSPANEHRIALPRIFFFLDAWCFALSETALVASGLVMLSALAVLVARLAVAGAVFAKVTKAAVVAGVVLALFSGTQMACLGWSFAVQFMAHSLLPALACSCVLRERAGSREIALATLAALGATFSIASSLLLWPYLVLLAAWRRLGMGAIVTFLMVGGGCWWIHLGGRASALVSAGFEVRSVSHGLVWSLTHLGSAWQLDVDSSLVAGVFGMALVALALVRVLRSETGAAERSLLAIAVLWTLFSAAMGYGRWQLGREEALAGRYAPGPLLYWAVLLALHLRLLAHRASARGFQGLAALCIVGLGLLCFKQAKACKRWLSVREAREVAALAIWLGDQDLGRLGQVFPHPELLADRIVWLREQHLSIFASPVAALPGKPLREHCTIVRGPEPRLEVLAITAPAEPLGPSFDLWSGIMSEMPPASESVLVATAPDGRVRGLGSVGWSLTRTSRATSAGACRWFALVPRAEAASSWTWYLLDPRKLVAHPVAVNHHK